MLTSSIGGMPLLEPPRPASKTRHRVPSGACDCHFHVFGPQELFSLSSKRSYTPCAHTDIDSYLAVAKRLRLERSVVVQPSCYGTDNSYLLHAVEKLGRNRTRAVAVVDSTFTQAELKCLDASGVRGARVNLVNGSTATTREIAPIAAMIASFGWHLELYVQGKDLPDLRPTILSLPVAIVIDHIGRIPADKGVCSEEFQTLLQLVDSEKCWVKLCAYRCSQTGAPYKDVMNMAKTLITAAPERCVWGTDWPHPGMRGSLMPDDGQLLDMVFEWVPAPESLNRILVDNPAQLYGFDCSA